MNAIQNIISGYTIGEEYNISVLTLENNEFLNIGSFSKTTYENINRLLSLINSNKPTLLINSDNDILKELFNNSLKNQIYTPLFSDIRNNKGDIRVFYIYNIYSENKKLKNILTREDIEYNLIMDYLDYLEQQYLIDYYNKEEYLTKMNILLNKIKENKYKDKKWNQHGLLEKNIISKI